MRFEQALTYEAILMVAFALLYLWYSYVVANDFDLLADNRWESAQNALFQSAVLATGSISPTFEPRTPNARALVTVHAVVRVMSALYYVLV